MVEWRINISVIQATIAPGNGSPPFWCKSISWTNDDWLSIGPIGTNINEPLIKFQKLQEIRKCYLRNVSHSFPASVDQLKPGSMNRCGLTKCSLFRTYARQYNLISAFVKCHYWHEQLESSPQINAHSSIWYVRFVHSWNLLIGISYVTVGNRDHKHTQCRWKQILGIWIKCTKQNIMPLRTKGMLWPRITLS